jgi:outer membrane protein
MKKFLFSTLILLLPLTSMADTVFGLKIGGGSWNHTPTGTITSSVGGVGSSADLKDDLKLGSKSEGYAYISIEHPIPLIPNIKISQTTLTSSGSGSVTTAFNFNGSTYSASTAVATQLELSQSDVILYYELLDNVLSFDIGLDAKTITGKAVVNTQSSTFSATVPLFYLAAEIALPANFAIGAEVSTISLSGNAINDVIAKVSYTTDFLLGVEVGVRNQSYKVDVDNVKADIGFNGVFAGVFFKF